MDDKNAEMVKIMPYTWCTAHIAYIGWLAIDPSFAGLGYGKKMMQEIIATTAVQEFKRPELSVASADRKAISLYRRRF